MTVHPLGPLLRQALTRSALLRAWEKVAGNRGMAGVDGESIDDLAPKIDALCTCLAQEVIAGEYRPRPLLRIWIPRPGKSPRGLAVPVVRDRLLQTSVSLALTPTVEAVLEDSAFAYRQGRGVRQAVERIGYYQRQGYRWIVDADIEAFFDNISHSSLLAQLQALVPEPALLQLIELWLTTPIQEGSRHTTPDKGIPQGSPVSPLLANLYLDTLDDALLDAEHVLVRYADDFIVLAKTRRRAEVALDLSREVLDRLSLRLNPLKTRIVHLDEGLEFLGWHFVRSFAVPKRWKEEVPTDAACLEAPPDDDQETVDVALAQAMVEAREEAPNWQAQAPAEAAAIAPAQPAITATASLATAPADEAPQLPPLAPLLRTLYVVDHRARLTVDNARYQVERDGKVILSLPALNVDQIILFGAIQTTSQVMHLAARHDCSIAWLSYMGRYYGRFEAAEGKHVQLLQAQFAGHANGDFGLQIARQVVAAKLHNSARVLARSQRHHKLALQHSAVRQRLVEIEGTLKNAASLDSLRGSEGAAAALYWQAFAELVPAQWQFSRRQRRPAPDVVNALLSLGYTLLYQSVAGILAARGLNAHLGYLHVPGGSHLALASHLMEAFRAYVVDATVLKLLHGDQLDPLDQQQKDGRCALGKTTIRNFIGALENRFNVVQVHPQSGVAMDLRRIIDHDVLSLLAAIRSGRGADFLMTRWR